MNEIASAYCKWKEAQIVLEILKDEKSISQLASEHEINSVQLNRWKNEDI